LQIPRGTAPLTLPLRREGAALGYWFAALAATALGLGALSWRRYRRVLLSRGILPPAAEPAYPVAPEGYRAPPPVKRAAPPMPVLSRDDRNDFILRGAVVLGSLGVFHALAIPLASSPLPFGLMLAAGVALCAAALGGFVSTDKPHWVLSVAALAFLPLFVFGALGLFGPALAAAVYFPWKYGNKRGSGGSSSSSSSSCGGGGGGCGGGGGGGGCGG
jgi:uncharacterized membrane protein YgcG